jgi:hypothetical protein
MASLISPEYQRLLRDKHKSKPWGGAGKSWVSWIAPLLNRFPADMTILDFGCGRATFRPEMLKFRPDAIITEYDPGVDGKDTLSWIPVDYIVCTDVMEHVEEDKVDDTLRVINFLAMGGVFFNIDTALSKSFLPDGTNTHITIKPAKWWTDKLDELIPGMEWKVHELTRSRLVVSGVRKPALE